MMFVQVFELCHWVVRFLMPGQYLVKNEPTNVLGVMHHRIVRSPHQLQEQSWCREGTTVIPFDIV